MIVLEHPSGTFGRRYLHDNDEKTDLFKVQGWVEWKPPVPQAADDADKTDSKAKGKGHATK